MRNISNGREARTGSRTCNPLNENQKEAYRGVFVAFTWLSLFEVWVGLVLVAHHENNGQLRIPAHIMYGRRKGTSASIY